MLSAFSVSAHTVWTGSAVRLGLVDSGNTGVEGESNAGGNGVAGSTNSAAASGVYGQNDGTGYGVAGRAANGIGVLAESANGSALMVEGALVLSRSGRTTVPAGDRYSQIALAHLLPKTSIIATVQGGTGGVWVQRVVVSPASGYFRIYLNKTAVPATRIAWIAIN